MVTAKISTKGQITLPKQVREVLDVKPGERIVFTVSNGAVYLQAIGPDSARSLAGSLSKYARDRKAITASVRSQVKKEVARAAAREQ